MVAIQRGASSQGCRDEMRPSREAILARQALIGVGDLV